MERPISTEPDLDMIKRVTRGEDILRPSPSRQDIDATVIWRPSYQLVIKVAIERIAMC